MSTTGGFGVNLYDTVAVYDKYVEYRVTNSTLNVSNYEPIYAVRGWEATEMIPAPKLFFAVFPAGFGSGKPIRIQPLPLVGTDVNSTIVQSEYVPGIPASEVPEPGYNLAIPLLLVVCLMKLLRSRGQRLTRTCRFGRLFSEVA
jgi:hypothetical protein